MGFQLVFLSGRGWPRVYFVYSPYRSHGMSRRGGAGVESESARGVIMLGLCENLTVVARAGRLGGLGKIHGRMGERTTTASRQHTASGVVSTYTENSDSADTMMHAPCDMSL